MIDKEHIQSLLPQRPPIVMVDTVDAYPDGALTTLRIEPDNIFVRDGRLMDSGVVEHLAQSAAAFIGARSGNVTIGYIGEIRSMKFGSMPAVGKTIESTIKVEMEFGGAFAFEAETKCGGEVVVKGRLKVFLQEKR